MDQLRGKSSDIEVNGTRSSVGQIEVIARFRVSMLASGRLPDMLYIVVWGEEQVTGPL